MGNVTQLHEVIAKVCPIDGVALTDPVRIDFRPEATTEQHAAAQAVVDNWVWNDPKKDAKEKLSALRYEVETGGISIEGQAISTERDEIGHWYPRFASAHNWLNGDPATLAFNPTGIYPYKPKGGEPTGLSAAQVVRAYLCVSWFINACFATEQYFYGLIESTDGSEQQIAAVMSQVQWPQREFTWEAPE